MHPIERKGAVDPLYYKQKTNILRGYIVNNLKKREFQMGTHTIRINNNTSKWALAQCIAQYHNLNNNCVKAASLQDKRVLNAIAHRHNPRKAKIPFVKNSAESETHNATVHRDDDDVKEKRSKFVKSKLDNVKVKNDTKRFSPQEVYDMLVNPIIETSIKAQHLSKYYPKLERIKLWKEGRLLSPLNMIRIMDYHYGNTTGVTLTYFNLHTVEFIRFKSNIHESDGLKVKMESNWKYINYSGCDDCTCACAVIIPPKISENLCESMDATLIAIAAAVTLKTIPQSLSHQFAVDILESESYELSTHGAPDFVEIHKKVAQNVSFKSKFQTAMNWFGMRKLFNSKIANKAKQIEMNKNANSNNISNTKHSVEKPSIDLETNLNHLNPNADKYQPFSPLLTMNQLQQTANKYQSSPLNLTTLTTNIQMPPPYATTNQNYTANNQIYSNSPHTQLYSPPPQNVMSANNSVVLQQQQQQSYLNENTYESSQNEFIDNNNNNNNKFEFEQMQNTLSLVMNELKSLRRKVTDQPKQTQQMGDIKNIIQQVITAFNDDNNDINNKICNNNININEILEMVNTPLNQIRHSMNPSTKTNYDEEIKAKNKRDAKQYCVNFNENQTNIQQPNESMDGTNSDDEPIIILSPKNKNANQNTNQSTIQMNDNNNKQFNQNKVYNVKEKHWCPHCKRKVYHQIENCYKLKRQFPETDDGKTRDNNTSQDLNQLRAIIQQQQQMIQQQQMQQRQQQQQQLQMQTQIQQNLYQQQMYTNYNNNNNNNIAANNNNNNYNYNRPPPPNYPAQQPQENYNSNNRNRRRRRRRRQLKPQPWKPKRKRYTPSNRRKWGGTGWNDHQSYLRLLKRCIAIAVLVIIIIYLQIHQNPANTSIEFINDQVINHIKFKQQTKRIYYSFNDVAIMRNALNHPKRIYTNYAQLIPAPYIEKKEENCDDDNKSDAPIQNVTEIATNIMAINVRSIRMNGTRTKKMTQIKALLKAKPVHLLHLLHISESWMSATEDKKHMDDRNNYKQLAAISTHIKLAAVAGGQILLAHKDAADRFIINTTIECFILCTDSISKVLYVFGYIFNPEPIYVARITGEIHYLQQILKIKRVRLFIHLYNMDRASNANCGTHQ